jgi:type III pantothenate kinase
MMLLAIDIGNTTTSFGVFERSRLKSRFSIATQPFRTADEVTLQLKALASTRSLHLRKAKQIIICSVVPRMTALLVSALHSLEHVPIRMVGQDLLVPLDNRYTYPEQVGQDRLVGAYAAWQRFRCDCLVLDFGTAITLDVVTKAGAYLGGIIAPGIEVSLEALASRTALLPKVELVEPPELLGRDTANSIRSGIIFGCAALCEGLVQDLKARYVPKAKVVATGGGSTFMRAHIPAIDVLVPDMVLEGLAALARAKTGSAKPSPQARRLSKNR